jgi:hypothetical protein
MDKAKFQEAPCYICGYNGPGYFQPETHPCAKEFHENPKTYADADGIAQGRREAADAYCDHICAMLSCRHTGKDKLACGIRHLILGTASEERAKNRR